MKFAKRLALVAAVSAAVAAPGAFATNGYFQHGYGVKAQGMGGAGIAYSQDAMAAATNPAGMVKVGNRLDFGLQFFRPDRSASLKGDAADTSTGEFDANETSYFFVPEFGWNKMLNDRTSLGVTVYGNGGMNTSYGRNIPVFGTSKAGIDLSQLFIAPSMAWKLSDKHSIGVAVNFAYQRFKAEGLENFDSTSQTSAHGSVTNRGYDSATGWGARIGWTGEVTPNMTLGATYQTKTNMSKFGKYKGLFAEQGDFDIPSNYGVGLAFKATPKTTLAFDLVKIKYTDSKAVSNPLGGANALGVLNNTLGNNNGAGFGWRDITVYKLGVAHQLSDKVTLRAGWNHNTQPIPNDQTFFNILAPGVVTDHLTLGGTWKVTKETEINAMYTHAFSKEVKDGGSIPTAYLTNLNTSDLKMSQNSLAVSFGWNF